LKLKLVCWDCDSINRSGRKKGGPARNPRLTRHGESHESAARWILFDRPITERTWCSVTASVSPEPYTRVFVAAAAAASSEIETGDPTISMSPQYTRMV
jgi:hypothetical protein